MNSLARQSGQDTLPTDDVVGICVKLPLRIGMPENR